MGTCMTLQFRVVIVAIIIVASNSTCVFRKEGYGETTFFVDYYNIGDLLKIGRAGSDESHKRHNNNADFIAHAREDLPDAISEIHRLLDVIATETKRAKALEMTVKRYAKCGVCVHRKDVFNPCDKCADDVCNLPHWTLDEKFIGKAGDAE